MELSTAGTPEKSDKITIRFICTCPILKNCTVYLFCLQVIKLTAPVAVGCNTAIGGQGQLRCMWPQSSVDPPPNCGLVSALCSRMPFTCYQRHNPDIFPSNAFNATTQISFFPFNAFNAATRFSYLHMLSTPTPGFFSSHTINVTTRVSSNLMLSAPPPGFLLFT